MQLFHEQSSQDICREVTQITYGSFYCLTKSKEVTPNDLFMLSIGGVKYPCANADPSQCAVNLSYASTPTITEAHPQGPTSIMFVGTGLDTMAGLNGQAIFKGLASTSVTVNSATEAVAEFVGGVPASEPGALPELRFVNPSTAATKSICVAHFDAQNFVPLMVPA